MSFQRNQNSGITEIIFAFPFLGGMIMRVLHVLNNLGTGGAENFVMNIYRQINRDKVQFDFLIRSDKNGSYVQEIKKMGGRVYLSPEFPKHFIRNYRYLKEFFSEHANEYEAIHLHANSLIYVNPLYLAKKYSIPLRVIHSHSSSADNFAAGIIHRFIKNFFALPVTNRFACSDYAGKWMFGYKEYTLIKNGIDISRFSFDISKRDELRKKLGFDGCRVYGHIGRFTDAKNHNFLIDVFSKIRDLDNNAVLLLIGNGERMETVRELVKTRNLNENVVFSGAVSNPEDYLSAMDVFLFPSLWEGFPVSLVEAQVNRIPCLISDRISGSVIINDNVTPLPIDDSELWANTAVCQTDRLADYSPLLKRYDAKITSNELEMFYLSGEI